MSEQKLRFYDIKDGEDSILLTDGAVATYADRGEFTGEIAPIEWVFGLMKQLGAVVPLEQAEHISDEDGPGRDQWVEVDAHANPLQ